MTYPVFLEFKTWSDFSRFRRYAAKKPELRGHYSAAEKTVELEFVSQEVADKFKKELSKHAKNINIR